MYHSATSDPSDGFSNHFSNDEKKITSSRKKRLYLKRRIRLYEKHIF